MKSDQILDYETVDLSVEEKKLLLLDQTLLPNKKVILRLSKQEDIWEAIQKLRVRGAPAIGIAAAMGLYLAAEEIRTEDKEVFFRELKKAKEYLETSRPTAVNLFWALERMENKALSLKDRTVGEICRELQREALRIKEEDILMCRKIGEHALTLVKKGDGLLTHCNAGQLATGKYGTATSVMYLGHERGYEFKIYSDETRPLLQGARLTSFELSEAGMDVTLICDNMAATVMSQGKVQAVFVGADRIAANGDSANKIGTYGVAVLAKYFGIPFYICAPSSTIDLNTETGSEIPIEERRGEEITSMWYEVPMASDKVKTYNPAFDVTPGELITAIITEEGVLRPPYRESLKRSGNKIEIE